MPESIAELIRAEAHRQGLRYPNVVAEFVRDELGSNPTPAEIAAAIAEFRRADPRWIATSGDGTPAVLSQADVRGRRGDAPEPPPGHDMNAALTSLIHGDDEEEADHRFARLAQPVAESAHASDEAMSDALRRFGRVADNPADALRRARGDEH